MKTLFATTCVVVGALLVPVLAHSEDTDKDRKNASAYVKDSVITTKVKAKLAEEKLSTLARIQVDTDNKGVVDLSGTVRSQDEADKAVSIARGTEGVKGINNHLKIKKDD